MKYLQIVEGFTPINLYMVAQTKNGNNEHNTPHSKWQWKYCTDISHAFIFYIFEKYISLDEQ